MKHTKLLIALFFLISSVAIAQSRFAMGVTFSSGFPESDFSQYSSQTGFGVTWDGYLRIGHSPVSLGTSLGFLTHGGYTRDMILSPTIPVLVPVTTSNNIFMTEFILRYQPPLSRGPVAPYVEGLWGFNHLWTQTDVGGGGNPLTTTNFSDTVMNYGVGGGLSFRLAGNEMQAVAPVFHMNLNLGVRYLFGGQANYLVGNGIPLSNGDISYPIARSNTNLLILDVGVGFGF